MKLEPSSDLLTSPTETATRPRESVQTQAADGMPVEIQELSVEIPFDSAVALASEGKGSKKSVKLVKERQVSSPNAPSNERAFVRTPFLALPTIEVTPEGVVVTIEIEQTTDDMFFCLHWGKCDDSALPWIDDEVAPDEIYTPRKGAREIRKTLVPQEPGRYGVTAYAASLFHPNKTWIGDLQSGDKTFTWDLITSPREVNEKKLAAREQVRDRLEFKARLLKSTTTFSDFLKTAVPMAQSHNVRGFGKVLFDLTREDVGAREFIADYFDEAVRELADSPTATMKLKLQKLANTLQNIGIGEVVFVSPEGPHANGGGLGQVINGLLHCFNQSGISCTLIAPLYEQQLRNRHRSADELINDGLRICGQLMKLERAGRIPICFGPTHQSGTAQVLQSPLTVQAQVFRAEYERVRVLLLRHPRFATRLYPSASSEELLRNAVFLSRGALELMRSPEFNLAPHIVISNDWLTGLVPVLLRTDPRYSEDEVLRSVETVHILHNCGRAYQGRLFVNQYNEDIFPILGISGEHFFGLSDPGDQNYLNLTAGAVFHVPRALITVSKPYAEELFSPQGGEGLHELFRTKKDALFGISNGVDLENLRNVFWQLGEKARATIGLPPLAPTGITKHRLLKFMPTYKEALKVSVQRNYQLNEDPNAVLLSFIGRLADQKGIGLLTERLVSERVSVLEALLRKFPEVQVIIGGPPSDNDQTCARLGKVVTELSRKYPGRIVGVFEFIPHTEGLEITGASDLFLMPSRYEPGGISQLEALATGTLVVARNVGGISATLVNYRDASLPGNAFLFEQFQGKALWSAIIRAMGVYRDKKVRRVLMVKAAVAENDWADRAPKYLSVLQHVSGVLAPDTDYRHLIERREILQSI